ncbi:hypothetical protein CR513_39800, partial [Mucuna pruriens]
MVYRYLFHQRHPNCTKKNLKVTKYNIWDDPYLWRLYNGQIPRSIRSSNFVIQHLEATTMDQLGQPRKCLIAGSTSPPFLETLINSSAPVNGVWGIDFIGPFPVFNGHSYILLAIDYAIATKTNNAKVVVEFLKSNIFYRFGVPKPLISDQRSHFCNRAMSSLLDNIPPPRQTTKLKYSISIWKSRKLYKRWPIPTRKTGADSLRSLYGHTKLHTGLC